MKKRKSRSFNLLNFIFTSIPVARHGSRSIASEMFCCWFSTYPASLFCIQIKRGFQLTYTISDKFRWQDKADLTLILLFESINRSATRESNFCCETSAMSGLKFKLFFNRRTLPIANSIIHQQNSIDSNSQKTIRGHIIG